MADVTVAQQKTPSRVSDGSTIPFRSTRDGSPITQDWLLALAMEGKVFNVGYGQGTTFVTAKTTLTAAQPDANLDIPAGAIVIPVMVQVAFAALAGTANHFWLSIANNLVGNGTSAAATVQPTNAYTGSGIVSACTARQAYSANGTAPTAVVELWSVEQPSAAGTATAEPPLIYIPVAPVILVGPASIQMYGVSTTTALQFKATITYAEFTSGQA